MRLSRALHKVIQLPQFSTSRLSRRANMVEHERSVFYYGNLFCIAITALPIMYLMKANYWTSEEQENLHFVLAHKQRHIASSKQLPL